MQTTGITTFSQDSPRVTGKEVYPVLGDLLSTKKAKEIQLEMKGLLLHWDCIAKAKIAQRYFGGVVVVGSLMVVSGDYKSEYGYYFNPPFELHAWVQFEESIIDVALPGVIEKGLTTCDAVGPFLVDRKPIILAASSPAWLRYEFFEVFQDHPKKLNPSK